MIKFFRRIRQSLLAEGKLSKYLFYAIGEIVLVVIGILIALQLNNWNEQRNIHIKQEKYLKLIRAEVVNNLSEVHSEKEQAQRLVTSAVTLVNLLSSDTLEIAEEELSIIVADLVREDIQTFLEEGAMNQVKSANGLNEIENDSIRAILASWDGHISRLKLQEAAVMNGQDDVRAIIREQGDMKAMFDDLGFSERLGIYRSVSHSGNIYLIKSGQFENSVLQLLASTSALEAKSYPRFEEQIRSLVGLIDKELAGSR